MLYFLLIASGLKAGRSSTSYASSLIPRCWFHAALAAGAEDAQTAEAMGQFGSGIALTVEEAANALNARVPTKSYRNDESLEC